MSSKLTLLAKAILADAKNTDLSDEQKLATIEDGMKSFAVDCLNLQQFLRAKGVDDEIAAGLIATQGIDFDNRNKRFK